MFFAGGGGCSSAITTRPGLKNSIPLYASGFRPTASRRDGRGRQGLQTTLHYADGLRDNKRKTPAFRPNYAKTASCSPTLRDAGLRRGQLLTRPA